MGVMMYVALVAVMAVADGLPVDLPSAQVGILDQSAESSEIHSEVAELPSSGYESHSEDTESKEPLGAATHGLSEHSIELQGGHQTFFPSFANLFEPRQQPLRLGYGNPEAAYSQRPNSYRSLLNYPLFGGYRNLNHFGTTKQDNHAALVDANPSILGSGNFGVIKGGTFLGQSEGDEYDGFSAFYNNGHGRPSVSGGYSANPRPNYNQDQFANFRDFADINAPSNSAYSHFVVVYANKNATIAEVKDDTKRTLSEPKNIMETLALLDDVEPQHVTTKEPKLTKVKAKLAKTKIPQKKQYWKKMATTQTEKHDLEEPLLALS